jgi:ATP-dependent Lon protease
MFTIDDEALARIVSDYTRGRRPGSGAADWRVARKIAARIAAGDATAVTVHAVDLPDYLGPARFHRESRSASHRAWRRSCSGLGHVPGDRRIAAMPQSRPAPR